MLRGLLVITEALSMSDRLCLQRIGREENIPIIFHEIQKAQGLLQEKKLPQPFSRREILVLTDSGRLAEQMSGEGIAVLGYEALGGSGYFPGADYVIQNLEGVTASFLNKVYQRYWKEPVVIGVTKRLLIRELKEGDSAAILSMAGQEPEQDITGIFQENIMKQRAFIKAYSKSQYPLYDYGFWLLEERGTGEAAGIAGIEAREDYLELGYFIRKEKRRNGYAKEALEEILAYIETELFLSGEIKCFVRKENKASLNTAQSLGFLKAESISDEFDCYFRVL